MSEGILVFIEQREGKLKKASLEALSEAIRQISTVGGEVTAALIAENGSSLVDEIGKYPLKRILLVEGAQFAEYSTEAYANALYTVIKKINPQYVFAANTALTKDLFPRVATRFDAPCLSDIMQLIACDKKLLATKAVYSGKARAQYEFENDIVFLTLRPNVFSHSKGENAGQATVEPIGIEPVPVRAKVIETHTAEETKMELSEASIIVSGGRGIQGPENWGILQSLCDVLGAALGASRAVVDAGWIDHQHQVGQTGKTVSPQLYIACGISGAIQHLAGMSSSKVIVAINKNPDAQIFKHATYAVVGDCLEIVPKLTAEIRHLKE